MSQAYKVRLVHPTTGRVLHSYQGELTEPYFDLQGKTALEIIVPRTFGAWFGFLILQEQKASETIELLDNTVALYGSQPDTEVIYQSYSENVGYVCRILRDWAAMFPDGRWWVELL